MEMEQPTDIEDLKKGIITQIAELSRLLGMIPSDDAIVSEARNSFLKLSVLISQALDIKLP
jgi:hypothetical protein